MRAAFLVLLVAATLGQPDASPRPERFTAIMNAGPMTPRPTGVDLVIERWGTTADRDRLSAALRDGGQPGLAMLLRKEPASAYIYIQGHERLVSGYVHQAALPDGGRHILFLCERRPGEWELANDTGRTEYLFRIVELTLDARNRGTGTIYHTAKADIGADGIKLVDELSGQPTALLSVRKTK